MTWTTLSNGQQIDYERGEVRTKKNGEAETYYPVMCLCGRERYTRKWHAEHADSCKFCRGEKGFSALAEKVGKTHAINTLRRNGRAHRLANPSSLEMKVVDILDQIGVHYSREFIWEDSQGYLQTADFIVCERLIIEVGCDWTHGEDRRPYDAAKIRQLQRMGFTVLAMTPADLKDRATARKVIMHTLFPILAKS